ncbi:MAG TPA: pyridoxamine 5'-phosphate oxidase family protein [Candidatus Elarobacter sp.]|nr:pyridoxamine 5'-phosphate oxidase family protein [Candidatus Elarobacter sp.]
MSTTPPPPSTVSPVPRTGSSSSTAASVEPADAARVPNTRVRRLAERARYDEETVHAILDEAYVAHVGIVVDGLPVVIPYACARVGDDLVLHGSTRAGILSAVASGAPVCATVTLLDGLVFARSAFHSSMNYRSVVVHGAARIVDDPAEKVRCLDALVDHLMPGRRAHLRDATEGELEATQVVAIRLDAVSAKVRTGGPKDAPEDLLPHVWGGVVPLRVAFGEPEADAVTGADVAPPAATG